MSLRTRWQGLSTKAKTATTGVVAAGAITAAAVGGPVACQGNVADPVSVPKPAVGTDQETWTRPDAAPFPTDLGAFRTNCRRSHYNYSDPIVAPGVPLATHLHMFFGNTAADYRMTDPTAGGNSTCEGGITNRSSYWAPAMLDGDQVIDAAPIEDALITYYKTGHYDGTLGPITPFPKGFRMIQGIARSTGPTQDIGRIYWTCLNGLAADSGGAKTRSIPDCPAGRLVQLTVMFDHCWDGVNLDSADHSSHVRPGLGWPDKGCPDSHPVQLPALTEHIRWRVPEGGSTENWRLSSDMYDDGPGGYSAHADFFFGWDETIHKTWVDSCLTALVDCRMGLILEPPPIRKLGPAQG